MGVQLIPPVRVAGSGLCDLIDCRLELSATIQERFNLMHPAALRSDSPCGNGSSVWTNLRNPSGLGSYQILGMQRSADRPAFFVPDGRMPFPVNHGASSEDSLLQVIHPECLSSLQTPFFQPLLCILLTFRNPESLIALFRA